MSGPQELFRLGPGSGVPAWLEELDRNSFGEAWGDFAGHEQAWGFSKEAFAIWAVNAVAGEAELLRIAVAPGRRGQGLGRTLLLACEAELNRMGIATLLLEVRVSNAPARGLYESAGWRQDGLRKAYYKNGEDAALYRKLG
ncbi:MAG: GNAT family N-acetyltransferase [Holophagaceae bacterium]|nr:GNAT family N-acetyltransferase [Holophagaceae bacterium]